MGDIVGLRYCYGVNRPRNAGFIESGSISWTLAQNTTTERKTSGSQIEAKDSHPDSLYELIVQSPGEATMGALTVNVYNAIKVDDTNERDVLLVSSVVGSASAITARAFLLQGLGIESGSIKIGMSTQVNASLAITAYYRLYRL